MPPLSAHNYSPEELRSMLAEVGENVSIHRSVLMFSPHLIHIGSNTRIDCFGMLSAGPDGIYIGDHVHIAAGVYLFGSGGRILLESFTGLSARDIVYTANDDYREGHLTNPTVPAKYKKVRHGEVILRRHALVGAGSIILPGVTLGVAASVGALSLVNRSVDDFVVVAGCPSKMIGTRDKRILEAEKRLREEESPQEGLNHGNA